MTKPSRYAQYSQEALIGMLERRDSERRYGLVWEREGIEADRALNDDFIVLDLDPALSTPPTDDQGWRNLIIEGDNWDALRALRSAYAGRVKCILIDPPYNTGSRDFAYNDRYIGTTDRYRQSLWLEFLYRRLILARDLLSEDGVILVCINDENRARLDLLMEQALPGMRVGSFVWKTRIGSNDTKGAFLSTDHEHILAYANPGFRFGGLEKTFAMYSNLDDDPNGAWRQSDLTGPKDYVERPNLLFPICDPATGYFYPANPGRTWVYWSRENEARLTAKARLEGRPVRRTRTGKVMEDWIAEGRVIFPKAPRIEVWDTLESLKAAIAKGEVPRSGSGVALLKAELPEDYLKQLVGRPVAWGIPTFKRYRSELRNQTQPLSSWIRATSEEPVLSDEPANDLGSSFNDEGARSLHDLFHQKVFNYAKPPSLMKSLLSQATEQDDIILDFFAGSGTTGAAALMLNAEQEVNRRFILVSTTEATPDDPHKNICRDVCAERIRRTIAGTGNADPLPGDFAYLRTRRIAWDDVLYEFDPATVWTLLQLRHDRPFVGYTPAASLQVSYPPPDRPADPILAFVPHPNEGAFEQLQSLSREGNLTVYTPVPSHVRDVLAMPGVPIEQVPDRLLAEFPRIVAGL
jgi:adenine-specific DNA-methyltransferase